MNLRADTPGRRCGWLALATGGLWLLTLLPAYRFFGTAGIEASTISGLACLVPGCVVFFLLSRIAPVKAQVSAIALGTVLRVAGALGAALYMQAFRGLRPDNYLIWLGMFYLVSLAVETKLVSKPCSRVPAG